VDEGIESISLNPDTVVDTWQYLAKVTAGHTTVGAATRELAPAPAQAADSPHKATLLAA